MEDAAEFKLLAVQSTPLTSVTCDRNLMSSNYVHCTIQGLESFVSQRDSYSPHTYVPKRTSSQLSTGGSWLGIRTEERLGSLTAAAGIIWAVYEATKGLADLLHLKVLPPGPLEVCAIGILIWLHGKWRRATKVR